MEQSVLGPPIKTSNGSALLNPLAGTANKAAHAQFIQMFVSAKLRLGAGASMEELRKLHATLCEWVQSHIMKIDTSLRSCAPKAA